MQGNTEYKSIKNGGVNNLYGARAQQLKQNEYLKLLLNLKFI